MENTEFSVNERNDVVNSAGIVQFHAANEGAAKAHAAVLNGAECEWFALCPDTATEVRDHPVLGYVISCERHGAPE